MIICSIHIYQLYIDAALALGMKGWDKGIIFNVRAN